MFPWRFLYFSKLFPFYTEHISPPPAPNQYISILSPYKLIRVMVWKGLGRFPYQPSTGWLGLTSWSRRPLPTPDRTHPVSSLPTAFLLSGGIPYSVSGPKPWSQLSLSSFTSRLWYVSKPWDSSPNATQTLLFVHPRITLFQVIIFSHLNYCHNLHIFSLLSHILNFKKSQIDVRTL